MKLFFETATQADVFLTMLPVGIAAAAMIDLANHTSVLRPLWDVLIFLLLGAVMAFGIILLGDAGLRGYHLLAVLIGALLYLAGIRRMMKLAVGGIRRITSSHKSHRN